MNDWENYFPTTSSELRTNLTTHFNKDDKNYHLKFCTFEKLDTDSAIYINSTLQLILLIEDTAFSKCSDAKNNSGGTIYYRSDGHFVQDRVCYYKSTHDLRDGIAFYLELPERYGSILYLNESSIHSCGSSIKKGAGTFTIFYGIEKVSNYNVTNNVCRSGAAYGHSINGEIDILFKYTNIRNNSQWISAVFNPCKLNTAKILTTSIIDNKRTNTRFDGIIMGQKGLEFENCCFLDNEGNPLFSIATDFEYYPIIKLNSCYFDSDSTADCSLSTENNLNYPTDISITYFSSQICEDIIYDDETILIKENLKTDCVPSLLAMSYALDV